MARASTWNGWQSSGGASVQGPTARIRPARTGSALDRCARIVWVMGAIEEASGLLLTRRAIVRGALPLGHRAHRRAAAPAGLLLALIDVEPLAEVTRCAVGAEIIAQRRAPRADRLAEHRAHSTHEPRRLGPRQALGLPHRPDSGAKQRLARVDVADADDEPAVHQQLLDGHAAPAGRAPEVLRVESRCEGLGRETGEQPVLERIAARVEETPEAARIVEAQREPGAEAQVEMVVSEARRARRHDAQVPRHPEMQQQRAGFQAQQQVLGAPPDAEDALSGHLARQVAGYLPAQARLVHLERDDALPERVGPQAPARRFDFRQLGQVRAACAVLLYLRLFVGDVLARH